MMQRTPEERLLDLIDNPALRRRVRQGEGRPLFDIKALFVWFSAVRAKIVSLWGLRTLNKAVFALGAVSTALLVAYAAMTASLQTRRFESLTAISAAKIPDADIPAMSDAAVRDAFSGRLSSGGSFVREDADTVPARLKQLRLVGVVETAQGRQAVVEDAQQGRSVMLSSGDEYASFTVASVFADAVVMTDGSSSWRIE